MLVRQRVELLVDVRRWPRSRHNLQFNADTLAEALRGIEYRHLPELGGWRRSRPDSPNTALRTPGFRGYADHMLTEEFQQALDGLLQLARQQRVAIMCAEATPSRCHRLYIADAVVARGLRVVHLLDGERRKEHTLSPAARVEGGVLTYPAEDT